MFRLFRKKEVQAFIKDSFGTFYFNREYGWFAGQVSWMGNMEEILLDKDEEGETADAALQTLHILMQDTANWDIRLRSYAARELTELANDWREENIPEIKEKDFAERIGIPSIHIDNKGSFEAVYDDDGMFAGHWIVVGVNDKGEPEDADIEG